MIINRILLLATPLLFAFCSSASATNLESALAKTGWSVTRSGGGDLIIRPLVRQETSTAQPERDSMESLRERLEAGGWDVRRDENGSLIVTRNADRAAEAPPPSSFLDTEARSRLNKAGWRLEEATDGSLVLIPPAGKTDKNRKTDPMEDFRQELQAAGWNTQRTEEGSLLLYPSLPATNKKTNKNSFAVMTEQSLKRLRDAGWTVHQGVEGELLLYPPDKKQSEIAVCPGVKTTAQVSLPVDHWKEAASIARSWLETQPFENLTVGRIRKVLRVHLVSIVNDTKPHRLRHQIAIRNRDGAVIVLD